VLTLAKWLSAKWSLVGNQQGAIALEIVEVFRGPGLKSIEIHGERLADEQARFKSSFKPMERAAV